MTRDGLLLAMVRAGWTDARVAAALDISRNSVRATRLRNGLRANRRGSGWHSLDWRLADRANDMRFSGLRPERIAVTLGISLRSVYRLLRPEMKDRSRRCLSAETRRRLAEHMRRIQPLGTAASRWFGSAR